MESLRNRYELAFFRHIFQQRSMVTTYALLFMMGILYFFTDVWGDRHLVELLYSRGANLRVAVLHGQWWRLVTSIFLHGGFLHFAMNGYVLVAFGGFFNRILGESRFLLLFILAGLAGSLASVWFGHGEMSVGASGGLWGLLGASVAFTVLPSPYLPEVLRIRMRKATLINVFINLGISFLPMIDFWAHIGGGIAGFIVGFILMLTAKRQLDDSAPIALKLLTIIAWLSIGASFYMAYGFLLF